MRRTASPRPSNAICWASGANDMTERKLIVLDDAEGVARHVADWIVESAMAKKGRFAIWLSGGSTPKRLYQILAEPAYQSRMPWKDVHLFWGDERMVPRDNE